MEEITPAELKQRLDNGDDIQIVDVREDNEVAIGRIPNSIHIPLGSGGSTQPLTPNCGRRLPPDYVRGSPTTSPKGT